MDPLLERMKSYEWDIPDQDDDSYQEIKRRIEEAGIRGQLFITCSELVRGIEFSIPSINNGKPFLLNANGWTGQDRYIIGQFLGKLSCDSYEQYGFVANAMVVDAIEGRPSKYFFKWMEELEAIPDRSEKEVLSFWAEQVQKAQKYYRKQRKAKPKSDDHS